MKLFEQIKNHMDPQKEQMINIVLTVLSVLLFWLRSFLARLMIGFGKRRNRQKRPDGEK